MSKSDSIELAYPIAVNSYDWAAQRYDAVDARIQTILSIGMTGTLAMPVAFSALKLSVVRPWAAYLASALFVLAVCIGTYARLCGDLKLVTPKVLYEKWLGFEASEFKRNLVYFAGQHMEQNRAAIAYKHKLLVLVTTIFIFEVACLAVAVVGRP